MDLLEALVGGDIELRNKILGTDNIASLEEDPISNVKVQDMNEGNS